MKRLLILLTIILFTSLGSAQQKLSLTSRSSNADEENYTMYLKKVYYSSFDSYCYISVYDSLIFNNKGFVETEYVHPDEKTEGGKYIYEYDNKGRMVQSIMQYRNIFTPDWTNCLLYRYGYDSTDNVIFKVNSTSYDVTTGWTGFDSTTYQYNINGKIIESHHYQYAKSAPPRETSRTFYTYDAQNRLVNQKSDLMNGGVLTLDKNITLTYDDNNNLIDSLIESPWIKTQTKKFYNSSNQFIYSTTYDFAFNSQPESWRKMDSIRYTYDVSGRVETKYEWYIFSDSELLKYSYDNMGKITQIEIDSAYKGKSRIAYEYNSIGKLNTVNYDIWMDTLSVWTPKYKAVYEYDAHENCFRIEALSYENNDWRSKTCNLNMTLPGTSEMYKATLIEMDYKNIKDIIENEHEETIVPDKFLLAQNYPNPFNPETKISFSLPQSGKTMLKVYDMLGREVTELVNGEMEKGPHSVSFNGRSLSSGVYIYRLQSGSFTESKKMMLIK